MVCPSVYPHRQLPYYCSIFLLDSLVLACASHSVVSNPLWPPWTVVFQAPLFMEFSRKEYQSGLAIPFSRGSFQPRDQSNPHLRHCRWILYWVTRGKMVKSRRWGWYPVPLLCPHFQLLQPLLSHLRHQLRTPWKPPWQQQPQQRGYFITTPDFPSSLKWKSCSLQCKQTAVAIRRKVS